MKIARLETFHVLPRWMFLKVSTDDGLVGWGEPIVEGRAEAVAAAVDEFADMLLGEDPRRIEHLWQMMYRHTFYRGGPVLTSAISGIEQALWDIKGKALGASAHELLGGPCRDRARMYAHCRAQSPGEAAAQARAQAAAGFTALKTSLEAPAPALASPAYIARNVERIAAMREAVGPGVDIAIDFHGRVDPAAAIRLARALEPLEPMFIEEPVLPGNVDALARVAAATPIPVATGERLFTRWDFREVLARQAAAVLQPDLSHCGGLFEARKIAAMAEVWQVALAPHNPLGPVSLAACLQLDFCIPNFLAQEHPSLADGSDLGVGLLRQPFEIREGSIERPTGPGLGIEVDEDAVRERRYDGRWRNPRLFHADGSVAEW